MPSIQLPETPLSDGVVTLRAPTEGDLEAVYEYCQDPEVGRWTTIPAPYSRDDARTWFAAIPAGLESGEQVGFLVVSNANGTVLGSCGLDHFDWSNHRSEIGYVIAAHARRQGAGTRALRLLSRWALGDLGLERVEALVHPENEPSRRLALAAGFTEEGVLRSYRERKGVREDYAVFSLIRGDRG